MSDKPNLNDSSKVSSLGADLEGTVDLNCDLGEGTGNDELIMPYISSANISCGYHAGDKRTIRESVELAHRHKVAIGAHVSFSDKENFGRTEMNLPPAEIYKLITSQLAIMKEIIKPYSTKMNHVKPHGALYNMSARDASLAKVIAHAIKDFDRTLILFGLSGSHSISEARAAGLKTASEVFGDRTYQDDGSLTPRSHPHALIEEEEKCLRQVLQMVQKGTVTSLSGKTIPIIAETICIHGDGKQAPVFAKNIYENLKRNNIAIKAISI